MHADRKIVCWTQAISHVRRRPTLKNRIRGLLPALCLVPTNGFAQQFSRAAKVHFLLHARAIDLHRFDVTRSESAICRVPRPCPSISNTSQLPIAQQFDWSFGGRSFPLTERAVMASATALLIYSLPSKNAANRIDDISKSFRAS